MFIGANYIKPYQKRSDQIRQIKATLRYNAHRPTLEGKRRARQLFGWDGELDKNQAYEMIDGAQRGTRYWRFKISPDPKTENPQKNVDLREVTTKIMQELQERKGKLEFIAVVHNDHSPIDHIHAIVIFKERMETKDYMALRQVGRQACLSQQKDRILGQKFFQQFQQAQNQFTTGAPVYVQQSTGMAGGRAQHTREPFIRVSVPRYSCQECGIKQFKKFARCPNCGAERERYAGLSL